MKKIVEILELRKIENCSDVQGVPRNMTVGK